MCKSILRPRLLSFAVLSLVVLATIGFAFGSQNNPSTGAGNTRDEYVVVKPDFGGEGYDQFYPQTLVVEQGDQVNIVIRNTDSKGFSLIIENVTTITIQPGLAAVNGTEPVDTRVPIFTASAAGIFRFYAVGHTEMNGQLVILPSDWSDYIPAPTDRRFVLLSIADFAGDGYDKFLPETLVVNQGDNVSLAVRNLDTAPHGFAMAAYGIDVAVNPAQELPNGTVTPSMTEVPTFTASSPGIFQFLCSVPCGPGHEEMVGIMVVLPKAGIGYTPDAITSYNYLVVKPDFAGEGYDNFLPGTIFANQGDLVYISVRNTDSIPHGLTLVGFNVNNETIAPATENDDETIPANTYFSPFFANRPGIYEFLCTIPCGPGHGWMIGYLVVLPRLSGELTPVTAVSEKVSFDRTLLVSFSLLIVGFVAGLVVTTQFGIKEKWER